MDLGPLRALALELNFSAHGVPIVVSVPGEDDVETRGIWITTPPEMVPDGSGYQRVEPLRIMAIKRSDVTRVPIDTLITAPEKSGDADEQWAVDGHERQEADHNRVILRRVVGG